MEAAAYLVHKRDSRKSIKTSVVFEQHGVYIHFSPPSLDEDKMLGGVLSIVEEEGIQVLQWRSYEMNDITLNIPKNETKVLSNSSSAIVSTDKVHFQTSESKVTLEKKEEPDPDWMLVAGSNTSLQIDPVIGKDDDYSNFNFSMPLNELIVIKKSKNNVGWKYLVIELADGATLPPLHFHQGGSENFLKALEIYLVMTPSVKNPYLINVSAHDESAMMRSLDSKLFLSEPKIRSTKAVQNPVVSALSGFSKMGHYIHDIISPQGTSLQTRPQSERANILNGDETEAVGSSRIRIKQGVEGSSGFEVITCADLGPRSDPPRLPPMDVDFWNKYKDEDGSIKNVGKIKEAIFNGGVAPELRKEVWKYLLNYFPWHMTRDEIKELKKTKEADYFRMKLQWKSLSPDQEQRFFAYKDHKSLVEKDVARTDRTRPFFHGQNNPNLQVLHDILLTYVFYNFNLGYVQGMNDLLSPILELMENEVDAFWCFVGFMNLVHLNFEMSQSGIKRQLRDIRALMQFLDPPFVDNLIEKDAHNFYFCFRWLLIWFKRDFSYEDVQILWEVLWTGLPCENYQLLISIAILDAEKSKLMPTECCSSGILKHLNELAGNIDLESTLRTALGIFNQLIKCKHDLPDVVRDILGLKLPVSS